MVTCHLSCGLDVQYKSIKTSRGPLGRGWMKTVDPVMTCYKVVRINFDYWGVQGKVRRWDTATAIGLTKLLLLVVVDMFSVPMSFIGGENHS